MSDHPHGRRAAVVAVLATSAEWYDFQIFGMAAALVFGEQFFPAAEPVVGVLAAFATFAVGFLARPLGGVVAGHFGDRYGRKPVLATALLAMGAASVLIGLLPGYDAIGVAAPAALVALRLVQGAAVGAQWGGAMLLATENAPAGRRGLYGGLVQLGVPIGLVTAYAVFLAAAGPSFLQWGWRVPFLLGVVLIGLAAFLHWKVPDTPAFRRVTRRHRSPLGRVLRRERRVLLLATGAFTVVSGTFFLLVTGVLDYATRRLGMDRGEVLSAALLAAACQLGALPAFAALSDRLGRLRVYAWGAGALALWAVPMFLLIDAATVGSVFVALFVGNLCLSAMYGPQAALFTELFEPEVRYTGASLGYQLGSLAGGAIAPFIMVLLLDATGTSLSVSLYIAAMALVALLSLALISRAPIRVPARPVGRSQGSRV